MVNPNETAIRFESGCPSEYHPAANLFPMLETDSEEYREFREDIQKYGQRELVVVFEGKILDGRNRHQACKDLGIEPAFTVLETCDDPVAYVLSVNLHRRHLTPGQRAMLAARIKEYYAKNAKARQVSTLKKGAESPVRANLPERGNGRARDQAAATVGVGGRSVDDAEKLLKHDPALAAQVETGQVSLNKATTLAALAKLPPVVAERIESGKLAATKPEMSALAAATESQKTAVARDVRVGNATTLGEALAKQGIKSSAKGQRTAKGGKNAKANGKPPTAAEMKAAAAAEEESDAAAAEEETIDGIVERHNGAIETFCRKITELAKQCPDLPGLRSQGRRDGFLAKIRAACETLRSGKVAPCARCHGEGCKFCDDGLMIKMIVEAVG